MLRYDPRRMASERARYAGRTRNRNTPRKQKMRYRILCAGCGKVWESPTKEVTLRRCDRQGPFGLFSCKGKLTAYSLDLF